MQYFKKLITLVNYLELVIFCFFGEKSLDIVTFLNFKNHMIEL